MANPLSANLQFTTLRIEDDCGSIRGTGFLVGDTPTNLDPNGNWITSWEKPTSRAYVVTARHVLGQNRSCIETTLEFMFRYNARVGNTLEERRLRFEMKHAPANWALHPDEDVDVAVLDVTEWVAQAHDAFHRFCPLTELANPVSLAVTHSDAGDEIFVLGYPLTLRQGLTNLPLVRKGVLASSPRRKLVDPKSGSSEPKLLRGFLVDGAILPGSSGSPVIGTSR
jgi:hypothetical protein